MGATVNPIFQSMVPGGFNPSSGLLSLDSLTKTPASGSNPLLPTVAPNGVTQNPFTPVSTAPTFGANAGPYASSTNLGTPLVPGTTNASQAASSPLSFLNTMSPKDLSRMFDGLKKTYGDGMAHMILDFLTGGAGFNQQAISNLLASMQPGIERGEENLMEQFSATGNRFGSPAAIGLGDFESQVNLNEGELITQMYEQAVSNFMDVMMGTADTGAKRIASSPSGLDSILQGIGLAGSGAQAASSAVSAISPGADTSILDAIGALAFV